MGFRHQLPVYSPLSATAIGAAMRGILPLGADPRAELRALLAREYDARAVLLCRSGTQALTIAIREALRRADSTGPVALPAFACFDVVTAAIGAEVNVSFYDIDPDTLGPDLLSLENVLKAGSRAVVIAPLYGIPVDWPALTALAEPYGAALIEDAAQGHGASWAGRPVGSLGEISILSFGRGKGWTGGNGGAVLFRGAPASSAVRIPDPGFSREMTNVVGLAAQWVLARPMLYRLPLSIPALGLGLTEYKAPKVESAITRTAAGALLADHAASTIEAEVRRANAAELLAAIAGTPGVRTIPVESGGTAGFLRLPVRLSRERRTLGSKPGTITKGIAPSYPVGLAQLPQIASRRTGSPTIWRGAELLVRELVTLPTHSGLSPREIADIADILRRGSN